MVFAAQGIPVEQKLLKAVEDSAQGVPQTDDITFVVVGKSYKSIAEPPGRLRHW
jgi:hypothetical protein